MIERNNCAPKKQCSQIDDNGLYKDNTRMKIEREDVKRNRGDKNRELKRDGSNKSNEIVAGNKGNDGVKKQRLWGKKGKVQGTPQWYYEIRNKKPSVMNIDKRKKERKFKSWI